MFRFKILQKYVLRELLVVFALSLVINMAVVCFAMLVTFVMRYSPRLELLAESLPWLALQGMFIVLPFSFLITVTQVYGRLSRDNEVTAIESSGTSVYFLVGPGMMLCLWVIFGNIVINDYLAPHARWELEGVIHRNASELLQRRIPTKPEFDEFGPVHLVYEVYDFDRDQLVNAHIRYFGPTQNLVADVEADRAKVYVQPEKQQLRLSMLKPRGVIYNEEKGGWYAIDDNQPLSPDEVEQWPSYIFPWRLQRAHYKQVKMMIRPELRQARRETVHELARIDALDRPVLEHLIDQRRWRNERVSELERRMDALNSEAAAPDDPRRLEAARELSRHKAALERIQARIVDLGGNEKGLENRRQYLREKLRDIDTSFCKRYSFAFSSLAYALVGVPLAIALKRAHALAAFGISSLFVFVVFWPLAMVGTTLGESGAMHPGLAMALPHLALGVPGIVLNAKLLGRG
mgnify:CR=1 FL=1